MTRLNINIEDKYLDVINIFKVSNKSEIELKFKKSDQQMAIQHIILKYMKQNNLPDYVEMLENNKE